MREICCRLVGTLSVRKKLTDPNRDSPAMAVAVTFSKFVSDTMVCVLPSNTVPSDPKAVEPASTATPVLTVVSTEKLAVSRLPIDIPPTESNVIATSLDGVVQVQGRVFWQSAFAEVTVPTGRFANLATRSKPPSSIAIDH